MIIHNFSKPASLWVYFISDRPRVSDIPMIFQSRLMIYHKKTNNFGSSNPAKMALTHIFYWLNQLKSHLNPIKSTFFGFTHHVFRSCFRWLKLRQDRFAPLVACTAAACGIGSFGPPGEANPKVRLWGSSQKIWIWLCVYIYMYMYTDRYIYIYAYIIYNIIIHIYICIHTCTYNYIYV